MVKKIELMPELAGVLDMIMVADEEDVDVLIHQVLAFTGYALAIMAGPPKSEGYMERMIGAISTIKKYMTLHHTNAANAEAAQEANNIINKIRGEVK